MIQTVQNTVNQLTIETKNKNIHPISIIGFAFITLLFICLTNLPPVEALSIKLGPFTISVALVMILLFGLVISFLHRRHTLRLSKVDLCMYLLTVLVLAIPNQIKTIVILYLELLLFPYLIGKLLSCYNIENKIKVMIQYSGLIQAGLVIYSPFQFNASTSRGLFWQMSAQTGGENFREVGTIGHPIVLAALLLPAFICWLECFFSTTNRVTKLISIGSVALLTYCIFITYSRGAWIALALSVIIILIKKQVLKKKRSIFFLITAATSIFVIGENLLSSIGNRFSALNMNDGSLSHRLYMFSWTWEQLQASIKTFLFGIGYGQAPQLMKQYTPPDGFPVMDNTFLTLAIELGLVGFVMIIAILFLAIKRIRTTDNPSLIIIIVAFCIEGLTFDIFYWEQTAIFFWVLIGFISNSLTKKENNSLNKRTYNV